MNCKNAALVIICCTNAFASAACSSIGNLVEKGGRVIDGSQFEFKTEQRWRTLDGAALDLRVGKDRDGGDSVMWTHPSIPYLTFYGTRPSSNGIFHVTRVHFLAGNYGGWNEYECEASGTGRFRYFGEGNASWTLLTPIVRGDINYGKIRRDDTRIVGERAVDALRGRDERIRYLTNWMREIAPAAERQVNKEKILAPSGYTAQTEFERYWKPLLLPRTRAQKKAAPALPELFQSEAAREALDTDWDEALSWIYVDYAWKNLTIVLNNEFMLTLEKEKQKK